MSVRALFSLGVIIILAGSVSAQQVVNFPDPNLEAAVRTAIGIPSGDILDDDLAGFTALTAQDALISDLTGLEFATDLTTLILGTNQISDLGPLEGLTALIWIELSYNQIQQLSPLNGLTNLTYLDLYANDISEIIALTDLASLTFLNLGNNSIVALGALTGLTALNDLELAFNQISDLTPLSGLTTLTDLDLYANLISDASKLAGLTGLVSLYLGENSIEAIEALTTLTGLEALYLSDNRISDISSLTAFTSLKALGLGGNPITDISVLQSLTTLTSLELGYLCNDSPCIDDVSVLANLGALTELNLSGNYVTEDEMNALAGLTRLTALSLDDNRIEDLGFLSGFASLTTLSLNGNQIRQISPLSGLTNIDDLILANNYIGDIGALASLTRLVALDLASNSITDIAPLLSNSGIGSGDFVTLNGNSLSQQALCTDIPSLIQQGVDVAFSGGCGIVYLRDEALEQAVRNALAIPTPDDIHPEDVSGVISLDLSMLDIMSLTGLEYFTGLTSLAARNNEIVDLTPLAGLTALTDLSMTNNQINNVEALSDLTGLTTLDLGGNRVSGIDALAGLTALEVLAMNQNQITNISVLSELSSLTDLRLFENQIGDITALAGLANLSTLYLHNNQVQDLQPLVDNIGLSAGDSVFLRRNPLSQTSLCNHIPALDARGVTVDHDGECLVAEGEGEGIAEGEGEGEGEGIAEGEGEGEGEGIAEGEGEGIAEGEGEGEEEGTHVYVSLEDGSDEFGDGSAVNAWATISFAMTEVEAAFFNPVTIHVAPGVYDEQVEFVDKVTVVGEGLFPSDTTIQYFALNAIVVTFADLTVLENVRLTTPNDELGIVILAEARDVAFRCTNVVFNGRDNPNCFGLFVVGEGSVPSRVQDNLFMSMGFGIRVQNAAPKIAFNTFEEIQSTAVWVRRSAKGKQTALTPLVGDLLDSETGFNSFKGGSPKSIFIDNQAEITTKAQLNLFELNSIVLTDEDEIRKGEKVSDRVDIFPFVKSAIIPDMIVGVLLNEATGNPIPLSANPRVSAGGLTAAPDKSGIYQIANVPAGLIPMTASATGYTAKTSSIMMTDDAILREDFALQASGEGRGDTGGTGGCAGGTFGMPSPQGGIPGDILPAALLSLALWAIGRRPRKTTKNPSARRAFPWRPL